MHTCSYTLCMHYFLELIVSTREVEIDPASEISFALETETEKRGLSRKKAFAQCAMFLSDRF